MKSKITVALMVLLLALSLTLSGCRSRDEAETDGLNDGLYNDETDKGSNLDEEIGEIVDDTKKAGEELKDELSDKDGRPYPAG